MRNAVGPQFQLRALSAIDAELPERIQLRSASRAVLSREILAAVWTVRHRPTLGQSSSAELAPLADFQRAGHDERSSRLGRPPTVAGVAARILRRNRDANFLQRVGR